MPQVHLQGLGALHCGCGILTTTCPTLLSPILFQKGLSKCFLKCHLLPVILCLIVVPAAVRSPCNSFPATFLMAIILPSSSLIWRCFEISLEYYHYIIKPSVLIVMFNDFSITYKLFHLEWHLVKKCWMNLSDFAEKQVRFWLLVFCSHLILVNDIAD